MSLTVRALLREIAACAQETVEWLELDGPAELALAYPRTPMSPTITEEN